MSNEIVKYHNNLSQIGFKNFNRSELNLFMTLCSKCQNQSNNTVKISFKDLRELANYEGKNDKRLAADIRKTNQKLIELNTYVTLPDDPGTTIQFNLFSSIKTSEREKFIEVRVNDEFTYILNELTGNFTRFELEEYVLLKSIYSKNLYRQLKRYRTTGWWKVDLEEFKRLIDIPESYNVSKINAKIIKIIEEEIPHYIDDFQVIKVYGNGPGKPIVGYEFRFKPEKTRLPYKPSGHFCRVCGKELYEMTMSGKICWAHPDGANSDAACSLVYNSIAEIEGFSETPTEEYEGEQVVIPEVQQAIRDEIRETLEKMGGKIE